MKTIRVDSIILSKLSNKRIKHYKVKNKEAHKHLQATTRYIAAGCIALVFVTHPYDNIFSVTEGICRQSRA